MALTTPDDDDGEVFPWLFKVLGLQLILPDHFREMTVSTPPLPPTKSRSPNQDHKHRHKHPRAQVVQDKVS